MSKRQGIVGSRDRDQVAVLESTGTCINSTTTIRRYVFIVLRMESQS